MARIKPEVQAIIDRHAAIDWRKPPHDPDKVIAAYQDRLKATGLTRPVRWITDPSDYRAQEARGACDQWNEVATAARHAWAAMDTWTTWATRDANAWPTRSSVEIRSATDAWRTGAAGSAYVLVALHAWAAWTMLDIWGENVAWDAWSAVSYLNVTKPNSNLRKLIAVYEPMIRAFEGGAFAHVLGEHDLFVLASPAIYTRDGWLHREDGPALEWPVTKLWFWKGVNVPRWLIESPETISVENIRAEKNQEVQRCMIERFGEAIR